MFAFKRPALIGAMREAAQWRLQVSWLLLWSLPTAVLSLPVWRGLSELLDDSVHAAVWARHVDGLMFQDAGYQLFMRYSGWLQGAGKLSLLLVLLISPWLVAIAACAARSGPQRGFWALIGAGLADYGRYFRLLVGALLLYCWVATALAGLAAMAHQHAAHAVLESQVDMLQQLLLIVGIVLFVLVHAWTESARAAMLADPGLRSATRALGRGGMQLLRRPLATLYAYAVPTVLMLILAGIFAMLRTRVTAVGGSGLVLALLLSQLLVLAMGWGRMARLYALVRVVNS